MIYIGTSGFKFDDWKGAFYPPTVPQRDWLKYYARHFNCLEVNATYYRLLPARTFESMAQKVPADFQFTVKLYGGLTHEPDEATAQDLAAFVESLAPLRQQGKFGCVLAQFPHRFHNEEASRRYLADLARRLGDLPLVVEFRSREWAQPAVFDLLRANGIGFCAVDEPRFRNLMPPIVEATSPVGYVRFHGRNYEQWWKGDDKTRYDYLYPEDELREWVPKLQGLAEKTERTYVFMNNCFGGKAAVNAGQMKALLQEQTIAGQRPDNFDSIV